MCTVQQVNTIAVQHQSLGSEHEQWQWRYSLVTLLYNIITLLQLLQIN